MSKGVMSVRIKCLGTCGRELLLSNSNFYKSNNSEFEKYNGFAPYCKGCLRSRIFDENGLVDIDKFKDTLRILNKPFIRSIFEELMNDGIALGDYTKRLNFGEYRNMTYAESDKSDLGKSEETAEGKNSSSIFQNILSEQDNQVKEDVVRLMGYDPFYNYDEFDQKFLYNELITYLDEDTLDDAFKLSQIIQLVNNNNQIRKIDIAISNMSKDMESLVKNQGEIKSLTDTKNKIVISTDKIAKENSISVKNRGDKKAGKSTLTYLMKQYRELGFEDAEQDYYDQNKAYGMKLVADISNKSIIEQLQFDENDVNDMFFMQREKIQELQQKVDDLEEENRKLHVIISNYKQN